MAVRSSGTPPIPWSKTLTEPQIHETASIHSFSNLIGDVRIGANVLIAPGTSIRADEGNPFHIGNRSKVQDGVVIHGLEQGRIIGDDGQAYSVWIGDNTSITHMALIHGPVYIGDNCFIGFRSTVFNARVGHNCIVMMHVLIQDVEIPPGKFIPSGSIITDQQQADRLPDIQESDIQFAAHLAGIQDSVRSGYHRPEGKAYTASVPDVLNEFTAANLTGEDGSESRKKEGSMDTDVVSQVRQLLAQGYRIGTEHADDRRFQTSSWKSCAPIQTTRESDVLTELQACLKEHVGEYVRLIGIDPKAKKRVLETIIQRPGDQPGQVIQASSYSSSSYTSPRAAASSGRSSGSGYSTGGLSPEVVGQIRQLIAQGARIGAEHADVRRFQTSSWHSCTPIQSTREGDILAAVEACLKEHPGEYVRLIGIDPKAKRRIAEVIVQRPNGKGSPASSNGSTYGAASPASSTGYPASSAHSGAASSSVGQDVMQQIGQLLAQGYQIGLEYADERRFRTSSWQSAAAVPGRREAEVMAAVQAFVADHGRDYVRLVGIDPKAKRRVAEVIVHRPNGKSGGTAAPSPSHSGASYSTPSASYSAPAKGGQGSSNGAVGGAIAEQVRQLLAQGYRIGAEYADERRFKTSSWQSGGSIPTGRDAEVISALNTFLRDHAGQYVRLIGIDPKAKRRVVETIIQQPNGR